MGSDGVAFGTRLLLPPLCHEFALPRRVRLFAEAHRLMLVKCGGDPQALGENDARTLRFIETYEKDCAARR